MSVRFASDYTRCSGWDSNPRPANLKNSDPTISNIRQAIVHAWKLSVISSCGAVTMGSTPAVAVSRRRGKSVFRQRLFQQSSLSLEKLPVLLEHLLLQLQCRLNSNDRHKPASQTHRLDNHCDFTATISPTSINLHTLTGCTEKLLPYRLQAATNAVSSTTAPVGMQLCWSTNSQPVSVAQKGGPVLWMRDALCMPAN